MDHADRPVCLRKKKQTLNRPVSCRNKRSSMVTRWHASIRSKVSIPYRVIVSFVSVPHQFVRCRVECICAGNVLVIFYRPNRLKRFFNAFCAFWSVEEKDSSVSVLQHVTSLRYEHTWWCFLKGKRNCLRQIANVSSGTILCCLLRIVSPYLCVRLPIPVTAYLSLTLILSPYCLGRFDRNFPFFSSPHPHLSSFFGGWWWWWWR